ncbi:MAG TPA: SDR family oxidoreductase [Gammaproteobacteria bacterium]|nr:SDR family oxidoreductase [Gammaproteobacteria bacterium]
MKQPRYRTCYVTGGSSGIGLAVARRLVAGGADVHIFGRDPDRLSVATAELAAVRPVPERTVQGHVLDVTDGAAVEAVLGELNRSQGAPDLLVNCAGLARPRRVTEVTPEQFEFVLRTNLHGTFRVIKAVLPAMLEAGRGHLVNTSSVAGFVGVYGLTDYCASKFGLVGLSQALRSELRPHGIRVSVLCPPDTDTPGFAQENVTKPRETRAISGGAGLMEADGVARELMRGLARNRFMIIPGWGGRFTWWMQRLAPGVVQWVMDRQIRATQVSGVAREGGGLGHP